jgi:purine-binding chemotaxis protein CheW
VSDLEADILKRRALALASEPRPARPPGLEALTFRLGGERFALPLADLVRVLTVTELVPLPGARPPLTAVAPWRGGLLPVLDLRLLGGGARGIADLTRILVIGGNSTAAGILAERIDDIEYLDPERIRPPEAGEAGRHVRGVTPGAVLVLDAAALLALHRGG